MLIDIGIINAVLMQLVVGLLERIRITGRPVEFSGNPKVGVAHTQQERTENPRSQGPVSYTHLTLPTT